MAAVDTPLHLRYVVDSNGEKTDVVIPLAAWRKLLLTWKELAEHEEDQEDTALLKEWLERRTKGGVEAVSLDDLERELAADGLLSG